MSDKWVTTLVESPYAGDMERNVAYAHRAYGDCLRNRREAPFASHLNYTTALDDDISEERTMGIEAGLALGARLERSAFYVDHGFSTGMRYGLDAAVKAGRPVSFREFHPTEGDYVLDLDASRDVALDEMIRRFDFLADLLGTRLPVGGIMGVVCPRPSSRPRPSSAPTRFECSRSPLGT